jgi:nitronate monooxygenase
MFKPLRIGKHEVRYPLIQGGMGVRVSAGSLAGHVAKCGGVGLVASPGITLNSDLFNGKNYLATNGLALKAELEKAYQIAPDGVIGVNVMVALSDFEELVAASIEGGAKVLVCGAGLPMTLPGLTAHAPDVALVPIVSSVRAAQLIAKKWDKTYNRLPDAVVVEDPDTAGGHLGEKMENIGNGDYDQYATVREGILPDRVQPRHPDHRRRRDLGQGRHDARTGGRCRRRPDGDPFRADRGVRRG